jgi:hypothetical protein
MAPNECTTNPSTSCAVCRACFPARRARAPRLAACRWSGGWATLAARLAEAFRSLTAYCCSADWGCLGSTPGRGISFPDCLLLFSRLGCLGSTPSRGIRSLTACCCSAGWVALVARMVEAFRFLTACCYSAGWAAVAARLAEASRSLTAYCCSTDWAALAARLAEAFRSLTACCCSGLCIIHKVWEP